VNVKGAGRGSGRDNDLNAGIGRVENGKRHPTEVDCPMTLGVDQVLTANGDQGPRGAAGGVDPRD
jgi:hypothetical protein